MNNQRLFTFGCSFTQYCWPTWADILGREFEYYENWGMAGGGNQYIFNSLIECHLRNNLQKNDTVIIMWTNVARLDMYLNGQWNGSGNILHKFTSYKVNPSMLDNRGFLIKDLAVIYSALVLLDSIGCNYQFHAMSPIELINPNSYAETPDNDVDDVIKLYNATINKIKPSVYTTMYNNDWNSLPGVDMTYISTYQHQEQMLKLQEHYHAVKGADWPLYDDFIKNKLSNVNLNIINDINHYELFDRYNNIIKESKKQSIVISKLRKLMGKKQLTDEHPLPQIHLKYIQTAMPEYKISNETLNWVESHNNAVLNDRVILFDRHQPNRL